MQKFQVFLPALFLLLAGFAAIARGQATTARVEGKVTLTGNPLSDAQVALISPESGKTYKAKTDKKGEFQLIGVQIGNYAVVINSKAGECLYKNITFISQGKSGTEFNGLNVAINDPGEGCGLGTQGPQQDRRGDNAKKQDAASKQEQAKSGAVSALLAQARDALSQQNWPAAETALQQVIKEEPDHWELYVALGGAQSSQAKYKDAVQTYETGIQKAQNTQPDPKNPFSDPIKIKSGIAQMLNQQGNAFLKLGETDEAVKAYSKAADSSPNPATAYYNLCSALYNMGRGQNALAACDKAIAADPKKADAYFIKGSILAAGGRLDSSGKTFVPAGAVEALKKYLELAPDGPHANEVKQMLDKTVVGN